MLRLPELHALMKIARSRLLRMHYENEVGHIGGNLSALDAMLFLHLEAMGPDDCFVLSKGHSAGALYIALWMVGKISEEELNTFHKDKTHLAGHPMGGWNEGIRFSTGSLGHGLGLASGLALGRKLRGEDGMVFCMTSDGEWQEGATWEALIFLAHHRLNNLCVLIDLNGLQGFGSTRETASFDNLSERIRSFNVELVEIDGHDPLALRAALEVKARAPRIVALRTVKGKGVSFMENRMEWHYLPLSAAQHEQAQKELEA